MRPSLLPLFFILLHSLSNHQATAQWSGCVDPTSDTLVRRGRTTPVCVVVSQGGSWAAGVEYTRYLWTPKADEYTSMRIKNSYKDLVQNLTPDYSPYISVHSESKTALSFLRRWYDASTGRIYPYLTAIISVEKGKVIGVTWDDACSFCGPARCIEITYDFNGNPAVGTSGKATAGCYFTRSQCDQISEAGGNQCDLTVFAVWSGTDVNGNVLSSFNSRMSAFPSDSIVQSLKDSITSIPDNTPFST